MTRRVIILSVALLLLSVAVLADGDKVEQAGAFADSGASDSIKGALEATGYKVSLGNGTEVCQIWFRKALAEHPQTDDQGAFFTQLGASSLIGVIRFPGKTTDYRGQVIQAGAYTLRYALNPADGNHLGIAQGRDFLLMSPVAADKDADAQFKFEDLVKMSAQSAGTKHPAGLSLNTAEGQKTFPAALEDDSDHTVLAVKLKTASGKEIPVELIVRGRAQQ
ncbi:MAG: hypothetical protein ACREDR_02570 [Blastocatellia bacterium]